MKTYKIRCPIISGYQEFLVEAKNDKEAKNKLTRYIYLNALEPIVNVEFNTKLMTIEDEQ